MFTGFHHLDSITNRKPHFTYWYKHLQEVSEQSTCSNSSFKGRPSESFVWFKKMSLFKSWQEDQKALIQKGKEKTKKQWRNSFGCFSVWMTSDVIWNLTHLKEWWSALHSASSDDILHHFSPEENGHSKKWWAATVLKWWPYSGESPNVQMLQVTSLICSADPLRQSRVRTCT